MKLICVCAPPAAKAQWPLALRVSKLIRPTALGRGNAWHLTRARPVAGDVSLCLELEAAKRQVLAVKREEATTRQDVVSMRGLDVARTQSDIALGYQAGARRVGRGGIHRAILAIDPRPQRSLKYWTPTPSRLLKSCGQAQLIRREFRPMTSSLPHGFTTASPRFCACASTRIISQNMPWLASTAPWPRPPKCQIF